jgi:hypothetical protein
LRPDKRKSKKEFLFSSGFIFSRRFSGLFSVLASGLVKFGEKLLLNYPKIKQIFELLNFGKFNF